MIDVCICTHGGDPATLERVLAALVEQTLNRSGFRVLIVDNANAPELDLAAHPFSILERAGVPTRIVREPKLGIAHARIAALRQSEAEAIVFVDDDNVLAPDFLEHTRRILDTMPTVGCFSGRIVLPPELAVPRWMEPLMGSLAMRNAGEEPIVGWFRGDWKPWIPAATASMVLRRDVAGTFLKNHADRSEFSQFGRKGTGLMSGEDFIIALSAADAGYMCGYFPQLLMTHHIRPGRLRFPQMARLMVCFGITDSRREAYLDRPPAPFPQDELFDRLTVACMRGKDARAKMCMMLYELVYCYNRARRLLDAGSPIVVEKKAANGEEN